MQRNTSDNHFRQLLQPLFDAGWSELTPPRGVLSPECDAPMRQVALRRSCLVLGVQHIPEPRQREQVLFVPVADHLTHPDDGIGLFDAITEPETITAVSHGLQPFVIAEVAARLGLLDPTRLPRVVEDAQARLQLLVGLYHRYVGRVAAKWRGGHTLASSARCSGSRPSMKTNQFNGD